MGVTKIHGCLRAYMVLQVGVFKSVASYRDSSIFTWITYRMVRVGVKPNKSVILEQKRGNVMKMVRRHAVIRLEKQRKSEGRFSAIKWEVQMGLGKRNYKTKDILGAYQDMQAINNEVKNIMRKGDEE